MSDRKGNLSDRKSKRFSQRDHRLSKSLRNLSTTEEISESPENSPGPDSKTETSPTIPDWSDFEAFQSFLNDNSSPFMRFSSQVSRSSTISSGSTLSVKSSRPTSLFVSNQKVSNQTTVSTHVFELPLPSKSVRKIKKCFFQMLLVPKAFSINER